MFRFPVFIYHGRDAGYYGFPIHGNSGTKIGIDAGGFAVTPSTRTFTPDPEREERSERFLRENIPGVTIGNFTRLCFVSRPMSFVSVSLLLRKTPERHMKLDRKNQFNLVTASKPIEQM